MKAVLHQQPIDLLVTTITFTTDPQNKDRLNLLRCPLLDCQEMLAQYQGKIFSVVQGAAPVKLAFIIRCRGCKTNYIINNIM